MNKKVSVLCIDDQSDFLITISFWLKTRDYQPITASNGSSGLEIVKQGRADVVIIDYMMPDMDGLEVAKEIRKINKHIPLIVVTVDLDNILLKNFKNFHISGLVSKMGDLEDLENLLKDITGNF